ncbi:MAG: maleylpyruvate isomerase N-terminal domain-containing protein [Chloroflexi bacterium]|nr:maleylpyruvate isomerase N-terminal domain-containing protein [Chloroflexota bacterium]
MSERATSLAAKLEEVNNDLAGVEGLTDEQWRSKTKVEEWTVAAAAHHVSASHASIAGMVVTVANGQALPPITMDDLNGTNAQHARDFATCDRAESVALMRWDGAAAKTSSSNTSPIMAQASAARSHSNHPRRRRCHPASGCTKR